MMLLDTHVVVWLAYDPERLSVPASRAIQNAAEASVRLAVSSVSIYEMAWLIDQLRMWVSVNRKDFFDEVRRRFVILPVDGDIALSAASIPTGFHSDPIDRLIVATALAMDLTLITADRCILASKVCKLLW